MVDLKPMPLSLTDAQLTSLLEIAEQLHRIDRDPFLRAVADRFAGKSEIGEGEFARALTSAFGEERTCPDILPAASRSKMTQVRPWSANPARVLSAANVLVYSPISACPEHRGRQ